MGQFADRTLVCAECGTEFLFSAGEQQFFAQKQFKNDPKRCKPCKERRSSSRDGSFKRETTATCEHCGKETTVPFRPTQGRPVYCRDCFQVKKASAGG